ncbi:MAG: non-heme ferritin [Methylococcaceae bacterium]|nr:non-heme ferritin [Methylococcaceae bacterium]
MLSKSMTQLLNKQINLEFYSSNLYLQMRSWCDANSLVGCARFLQQHADEEIQHMHRLFNYVNEAGSMALIGAIDEPKSDFKNIQEVFKITYKHECLITKEINKLVKAASEEADFSTFNFLQWYVAEQHEEEHLFNSIIDIIKMIGIEGKGLYFIDKEIGAIADKRAIE